jgi:membrane dipeptidase
MFVLDSHCDTPTQLVRFRDNGIEYKKGHVDYLKLKKGGVDGSFFALYIPASLAEDEAFTLYQKLHSSVKDYVTSHSDSLAFATSSEDALANQAAGKTSIFLGLENASPLGRQLSRLDDFYNQGIRYITLCHTANNEVCDSCATAEKRWKGLSPFGREVIARMNELGILVDVSHISDEAFFDVLETSSAPVAATHSCCRALSDHSRNMTDEMIMKLAEKGGVIQINFYPVFLDSSWGKRKEVAELMDKADLVEEEFKKDLISSEKRQALYDVMDELCSLDRPGVKEVVDHIDHAVRLVGDDHVGLGSDFDGIAVPPKGLEDVSMFSEVLDEMRKRGYSEASIEKIAGKNFLRVLSQAKSYK